MKPIRLGTRPSALALWQANWTRDALEQLGVDVEIVKITTSGDANRTDAIANLGAQGVFTKEIQRALLLGEIDVAAHSLKDLPVEKIPGLQLTAVPQRADCRDVFVSNKYASLDELPRDAVVGTSSMRRKSMLLRYCAKRFGDDDDASGWDVRDVRGNVETRLKKLDDGEYDALVLASAGLERLGLGARVRSYLERPDFLPAVGQGALGLETRADDEETIAQVERLIDPATFLSVVAERALLETLQGGCLVPIGARGERVKMEDAEVLQLDAQILSFDGRQSFSTTSIQILDSKKFPASLPFATQKDLAELLGKGAAQALLDQGATGLVEEIRRVRDERNEKLRKRSEKQN